MDNIGRHAQKTLVKLLDKDAVTFLGTDTHRVNTNYTLMNHMIKKFKKKIGETRFNELSNENPQKIIRNEVA